jgi:L-glutamine-phosphate cytidylyltransferase
MKTIFLTAGRGSRLNHLTKKNHKSLLSFNEKESILGKLVNQFIKQGIKKQNITFITGYKSKKIFNHFGSRYKYFYYNNFKNTNNLHTLIAAKKTILNNDTIISFSDIVIQPEAIKKIYNKTINNITLLIDTSKVRNGTMKVELKNKHLIQRVGRIPRKIAKGNFIGILKIPKNKIEVFKKFLQSAESKSKNSYYTEILNDLIKKKNEKIEFIDIKKHKWIEVDNLSDYKKMRNRVENFN